jgi:hypothetical protein
MKITGEIKITPTMLVATSEVQIDVTWKGGQIAKLAKDVLQPLDSGISPLTRGVVGLPSITLAKRTGRSTILLTQTRLRVIAEREYYLVVMRDSWKAIAVQVCHTAIEKLTKRLPRLFGWLKPQLL